MEFSLRLSLLFFVLPILVDLVSTESQLHLLKSETLLLFACSFPPCLLAGNVPPVTRLGRHSAHCICFMSVIIFTWCLAPGKPLFCLWCVRWENGPCYFILSMSRSPVQFALLFHLKHKYLTSTVTVLWLHQDLYSLNPSFSFISLTRLQLFSPSYTGYSSFPIDSSALLLLILMWPCPCFSGAHTQ